MDVLTDWVDFRRNPIYWFRNIVDILGNRMDRMDVRGNVMGFTYSFWNPRDIFRNPLDVALDSYRFHKEPRRCFRKSHGFPFEYYRCPKEHYGCPSDSYGFLP
eukprot:5499153-Pyramimonas_sp.AAC.1